MDNVKISSFGSKRAARAAKAKADQDTQEKLWIERIRNIMLEEDLPAALALDLLHAEVKQTMRDNPRRKMQIVNTWNDFHRRIQQAQQPT